MSKRKINIILLIQHLIPWFERQRNRLEYLWTKNKQTQDIVEKWDRDYDSYEKDAQYTSQVLSMESFLSKKIDDFYKLHPLQGTVNTLYGTVDYTDTIIKTTGSTATNININVNEKLDRTFISGDKINFECYLQPSDKDKIPYAYLWTPTDGPLSENIQLAGGYNNIALTLNDNPSEDLVLVLYWGETTTLWLQDYNIYYKRSGDIFIRDEEADTYEYVIGASSGDTLYPTYTSGLTYNIDEHSTSNVTLTSSNLDSDVMHIEGTVGSGGGNIRFSTDCPRYWTDGNIFNYANLSLTGNTGMNVQLTTQGGGVFETKIIYTYTDNNLTGFDYSNNNDETSTEVLHFQINFDDAVDFSMDIQFQVKGGFFYNYTAGGFLSNLLGVDFIIRIDDRDYGIEELRDYLSTEIDKKRPATSEYAYIVY